MSVCLTLLAMPHSQALRLMIQDALKPGLSIDSLLVGNAGFGAGTDAHVGVFLSEAAYQDPTWPYRGQVDFHYRRLSFADFFQGIDLAFRRTGTFYMSELVTTLCSIFNIVIEPTDYINNKIVVDRFAQNVTLTALPVSPRWIGSVNIRIVDANMPDQPIYVDEQGSYYIDHDSKIYITNSAAE